MKTIEKAREQAAATLPSGKQIAWQRLEFIGFIHFSVNTFTDREWGEGTEQPDVFNPTALDCKQWARAAKEAGMKLLILTAKHHDGFCLWPTKTTEHSVKSSSWKDGKGDVVKEFVEAVRAEGLQTGIYCSPWDRNSSVYGTPAYNDLFCDQLEELLTWYGPMAEVWLDGACGEGPNGKKQNYDWKRIHRHIHSLQPNACIGPSGPDIRWVGNESGYARESEWSVVGVDFDEVPKDNYNDEFYLVNDYINGESIARATAPGAPKVLAQTEIIKWWPAETDVSIRPGWFYHAGQDLRVHSLEKLMKIYYESVGRNSVLLLNLPPDRRGLIHEIDVERLRAFRTKLDKIFRSDLAASASVTGSSEITGASVNAINDGEMSTWWQPGDGDNRPYVELSFSEKQTLNCVVLQEHIDNGQQIESFVIEGLHENEWKPIKTGTTVGYKKIERFGKVAVDALRIAITGSRSAPTLEAVKLYLT